MPFWNKLTKVFHKNRKTLKYKEIFSTTGHTLNLQNTNPLDVPDVAETTDLAHVKSLLQDEFDVNSRADEFLTEENSYKYPKLDVNMDPQSVKNLKEKLRKDVKFLKIQVFLLIFLFMLSFAIDVFMRVKPAFLSAIPVSTQVLFPVCIAVLFILSCLAGFKVIKSAVVHAAYAVFAPVTAIIFPLITTLLNCTFAVTAAFLQQTVTQNTFLSLFIFNFILIVLSLLSGKKRVLNNLKFVTASKQKYNIDMCSMNDLLTSPNTKKNLFSAYQHKTNFLTDFIKNSHKETFSERIFSIIIPGSIIFSVLCGILSFILSKDFSLTIITLNITSLICLPFALPFTVNSVVAALCKHALKLRAMIIGENAVRKLADTNCIVLSDADLYPPNNVVLRGIKTFNGQRIDEAILSAAAVVCQLKSPISQVFDKIIMGKRTLLTKVSDIVYKEEKGAVGWVNGKQILVGNRELLKEFKISPPSRDYEQKYRLPNCELTYFAMGRELVAMFVLEYTPSKSLMDSLAMCVKNNVKIFIKTVDSNLTLEKIVSDFNLNEKFLTLLPAEDSQNVSRFFEKTNNNSKAFAATFGSVASFIKTVCACCIAKNNIILCSALQLLQLALNFILIIYLIICSSLPELHTLELTIYSLLWFFFTFIATKIKKFN